MRESRELLRRGIDMNLEEVQRVATDPRPRLSWRIGMTGHRTLAADQLDAITHAVEDVFDAVADGLSEVRKRDMFAPGSLATTLLSFVGLAGAGKRDKAGAVFALEAPVVTLLSSIAEGADRLCADLALKRGIELRAPLPLSPEEYAKDFPGTAHDFERLLDKARGSGGVVELDGHAATEDERNKAYMAAGQFVVRNCDLLIAIWNSKPAQGFGGTAMVVDYARSIGVPVVHILSVEPEVASDKVRVFESGAWDWTPFSKNALAQLVANQIVPKLPAVDKHGHHIEAPPDIPPLTLADRYFQREPLTVTQTDPDFLYAGPFEPNMPWPMKKLSGLFPRFVKALAGNVGSMTPPAKGDPPFGRNEPNARYLYLHYQRADALATFYANVHRSGFLLVYCLGALALSFAVAAIEFRSLMPLFTGLELVALILTAVLVGCDNAFAWRARWLEYRLLAELLRETDLLAQMGRPMPFAKLGELARDLANRAWVTIVFGAIVRRAGTVSQKFDETYLAKFREYVADTRLQDQIAYHEKAARRARGVERVLNRIGIVAFVGTVLAAVAKLRWREFEALGGVFAGVLPAIAYAAFSIRNQAEFEIVSRRSERMSMKLRHLQRRFRELQGARLNSEALGREVLMAARIMRHDAADWASIFEVKETGV